MTMDSRRPGAQSLFPSMAVPANMVPAIGSVVINNMAVGPRDGAAIHKESIVRITAAADAELVLVDAAASR